MRLVLSCAAILFAAIAFAQPAYDMRVSIRPSDRFLGVEGTVVLPAQSQSRSKLFFQLAQQMQNLQMEIVSPAPQVLKPKMVNDNTLGTGNFSADLDPPIPANTPATIKFSYQGGNVTAFVFHIGEEGTYADGTDIAWYPEFGPELDQDGKFAIDAAANVVGKATYVVPSDLTLVASGQRTSGPSAGNTTTISYSLSHPTTFAFALDHFRVLRSPGKVPVTLYLKEPKPNEQAMLDGIRQIVDELTNLYGAFPYPEFALVEVNDKALEGAGFGGAGCPGFMLSSSSFLDQGFNIAFFGHEISHQWWGNEIVHANESEGNDLLDEAIAQYGSLWCVKQILGSEAAAQYRYSGFPGYVFTQCGHNYLHMAAAGIDLPLQSMPTDQGSLAHELACEKGFLAFEELSRAVGVNDFHKALKNIVATYAFRQMTWQQFKDEVGKASHQDLQWFWRQWFEQTGAPTLGLTWTQNGSRITGTIDQEAPAYRLSVPVRVEFENGDTKNVKVPVKDLKTSFEIPAKDKVARVDLDPDFEVLHYTPSSKKEADAFVTCTKAEWLWFSDKPEEAKAALKSVIDSVQSPDEYGIEFRARYDLAQLLISANNYSDAMQQLEAAGRCVVQDPQMMPNYYRAMMICADHLGDKAKAHWAAEAAILTEKRMGQYTRASVAAEKYLASPH